MNTPQYRNQSFETLDLTTDAASRTKFLANFNWMDPMLAPNEIERIEDLLVQLDDIFARHRLDN